MHWDVNRKVPGTDGYNGSVFWVNLRLLVFGEKRQGASENR
jgi:hypothetical protein